ncbi:putative Ig domain-containing protein [uncultured Photobacterium sp.]|uniref:putative Ig domain-containing protein n=1 Tax=uncultured Photobacterium sp. TaxID=173973 RepID=UPI00261480CB|nr:putative Ig domain-containing protein [uncultured Photobacterium sp.]
MMKRIAATIMLLFSCGSFAAEKVDLRNWSQIGLPDSGTWTVSPDGSSVYQSINGHPTVYLSNEVYDYRVFRGSIEVNAGAGDDDYIGFIFGYSDNHFYLFDWRKGISGDNLPGFVLLEVNGTLDDLRTRGWGAHQGSDITRVIAADTSTSNTKGWTHGIDYPFQLELTPNKVKISVNNTTIFEVEESFTSGNFGFFNWSQGQVTYNSIEQLYPPKPDNKTLTAYQGLSSTITGTYTDENSNDTHTCKVNAQPSTGYAELVHPCSFRFFPSPDHDGEVTFSYAVTDTSNLTSIGEVTADVYSSGATPLVPDTVRAGSPVSIPVRPGGQAHKAAITVRELPSWLKFNGTHFTGTPTATDIGYHTVQFTSSSKGYSHQFGPYTIKVLPPHTTVNQSQQLTSLPSTTSLKTQADNLLTYITLPPLVSDEGFSVAGIQEAVFSLAQDADAPVIFDGHTVAPGQTVTVNVVLNKSGTQLPVEMPLAMAGTADFSLHIGRLRSPDDSRPLVQIACGDHDSSHCTPKLQFDGRQSVGQGEVQLMAIKSGKVIESLVVERGGDISQALELVENLPSDTTLAANFNGLTGTSNNIVAALKQRFGLDVTIRFFSKGSAVVTIENGKPLVSRFNTDWSYGTHSTVFLR